jgi:hypothetical protein
MDLQTVSERDREALIQAFLELLETHRDAVLDILQPRPTAPGQESTTNPVP